MSAPHPLETRLGHHFADRALLARALTHASLSSGGDVKSFERLEFLGDRVLGLLTAETLWRRYPEMEEGRMAPRLNALVRKETCARAARHFGVDEHLQMSDYEAASGGRRKTAILGDAMEALLGALYIDGGLAAAARVFDEFWGADLEDLSKTHRDAKTALQEWSQERKLGAPDYAVIASEGPDHAPSFVIEARVKGFAPARGEGRSKRAAQMAAAKAFLLRQNIWKAQP